MFERSRAFAYLNVIKRRFQQIYGQRAMTAMPYAMNNDFAPVLASEMASYTIIIGYYALWLYIII